MRRIVHLSDLHFGRVDYSVLAKVVDKINELQPHLVVVSGDLTQRARSSQFIEAREFLGKLPTPQIVVPGNHDVPLFNILDRFARPLDKFKKYISTDLSPMYIDDQLAVIGINTARSFTIKGGRINQEQVACIRDKMGSLSEHILKIVVTHHPFDVPDGLDADDIVGRAKKLMPMIADCGADLFLSGHLHISHILDTAMRYKLENGRSALVIQAGTAASTRGRGEAHSFNLIEFESPSLFVIRLDHHEASGDFVVAQTSVFKQSRKGWESV